MFFYLTAMKPLFELFSWLATTAGFAIGYKRLPDTPADDPAK
jgi:hypothetical protein